MLLTVPETFISFLSVQNLLVSYDCQMVYELVKSGCLYWFHTWSSLEQIMQDKV